MFKTTAIRKYQSRYSKLDIGYYISSNKIALYNRLGMVYFNPETGEFYSDNSFNRDDCVAVLVPSQCDLPTVLLIKEHRTFATLLYNKDLTQILWQCKNEAEIVFFSEISGKTTILIRKNNILHEYINQEGIYPLRWSGSFVECHGFLQLNENEFITVCQKIAYITNKTSFHYSNIPYKFRQQRIHMQLLAKTQESTLPYTNWKEYTIKILDLINLSNGEFASFEEIQFRNKQINSKFILKIWLKDQIKHELIIVYPPVRDDLAYSRFKFKHLTKSDGNLLFIHFLKSSGDYFLAAIDIIQGNCEYISLKSMLNDKPRYFTALPNSQFLLCSESEIISCSYQYTLSQQTTNHQTTNHIFKMLKLSQYKKNSALTNHMAILPIELWLKILTFIQDWNDILNFLSISKEFRDFLLNLAAKDIQHIFPSFECANMVARHSFLKNMSNRQRDYDHWGRVNDFAHTTLCFERGANKRIISVYSNNENAYYLVIDNFKKSETKLTITSSSCLFLNESLLLVLPEKGGVVLYSLINNHQIAKFFNDEKFNVSNTFLLTNGKFLALHKKESISELTIFQLTPQNSLNRLRTIYSATNLNITHVSATGDGKYFCYVEGDQLRIYHAEKLQLLHSMNVPKQLQQVLLIDKNRVLVADNTTVRLHYLSQKPQTYKFSLGYWQSTLYFKHMAISNKKNLIAILAVNEVYLVNGRDLTFRFKYDINWLEWPPSKVAFYENDLALYLLGKQTRRISFEPTELKRFEPSLPSRTGNPFPRFS